MKGKRRAASLENYNHGWSIKTQKRALKDHQHKKAVKKQKQYLKLIKTPGQLRDMRQQSRRKQKGG